MNTVNTVLKIAPSYTIVIIGKQKVFLHQNIFWNIKDIFLNVASELTL